MRCLARHTQPGNCPRQFQGNKGGTTPENLFPAALRAAFKFPLLKVLKKVEGKTSKEFINCLTSKGRKATASGVLLQKCLASVQEDSYTETKALIFV